MRDAQFLLVVLNSCVNPYICTIRLKQYRLSLNKLVEKFPWTFTQKKQREDILEPLLVRSILTSDDEDEDKHSKDIDE